MTSVPTVITRQPVRLCQARIGSERERSRQPESGCSATKKFHVAIKWDPNFIFASVNNYPHITCQVKHHATFSADLHWVGMRRVIV